MPNDLAIQVIQMNDIVQELMQDKVKAQESHRRVKGCWVCGELKNNSRWTVRIKVLHLVHHRSPPPHSVSWELLGL